jgi:hypothetical protein
LVAGNPARIIREIVAPQDYIRFDANILTGENRGDIPRFA